MRLFCDIYDLKVDQISHLGIVPSTKWVWIKKLGSVLSPVMLFSIFPEVKRMGRGENRAVYLYCAVGVEGYNFNEKLLLQGHSVSTKRTSDGKVDTLHTLHNLNEGLFSVRPLEAVIE